MNTIPSDDEFARAKRAMAELDRNLEHVTQLVIGRCSKFCRIHNMYILWQRDVDFRVYVFFSTDADIREYSECGITKTIEEYVYNELELAGRGKRSDITVAFEYDSDENVQRHYDGDYLARLR
jgi:hypothetical protein